MSSEVEHWHKDRNINILLQNIHLGISIDSFVTDWGGRYQSELMKLNGSMNTTSAGWRFIFVLDSIVTVQNIVMFSILHVFAMQYRIHFVKEHYSTLSQITLPKTKI